jgi:hypothetical protein
MFDSPYLLFFYWLFGSLILAAFGSGHDHGTSLLIFVAIVAVGLIGGVTHTVIALRRRARARDTLRSEMKTDSPASPP